MVYFYYDVINIMYQGSSRQVKEATLYQDLTEMIKLFKIIMSTSQSISLILARQSECVNSIRQLKDILQHNQKISHEHNYQIDQMSPHRNTYFRFICRLIENVELYKNKFRAYPTYSIFNQFIKKTQIVLNSWKDDRNICKLFKKIFALSIKFCTSCQIVTNNGSHQQALDYLRKEGQEKIFREGEIFQKKLTFYNSQSNFHRVMGGLTKRFSSMNCLDLDYSSFKATFFQSKSQKDDVFAEMMFRNAMISRQILLYSKQFEQYLKRRDKQATRKNRFKQGKTFGNTVSMSFNKTIHFNKSLDVTNIAETEKQKSQHPNCQYDELAQSKRFKTKQSDMSEEKNQTQKPKKSYQIKNIYLTLNKIQGNSQVHQKNNINTKFGKDKAKMYSILKSNKFALKSTKFTDSEIPKVNRPLLQVRHIEFRCFEARLLDEANELESKYQKNAEQRCELQGKLEKKNIRITQLLKKNSFNFSIKDNTVQSLAQGVRLKTQDELQQQLL